MNRIHSLVLLLLIGSQLSLLQAADPPQPRVVPLEHESGDLVPVISYDVTAEPYSADPYGKEDCTEAFAAALSDADRTGGTVFAPAGRYRFEGELVIPSGVTLRGDWKQPSERDARVGGTILLAYSGRGSVEGNPFVTAREGGLRDVSIFYPEQDAREVAPYPVTVHLAGSAALKNVTLVNAYRGVLTGGFSTVFGLYGTTLETGLTMLNAASVPRCWNVRLSPRFWSESGLPKSPSLPKLKRTLSELGAFGIQLNRQDAGIFIDVEIEHYPTGVKFMPPHGWTYWYDLRIRDSEVGIHFTGGSHQRMYVTGSSIEASRYGVLMQMDKTGWDEAAWQRMSKSGRPFGTPRDRADLRMFDCRFSGSGTHLFMGGEFFHGVSLQECVFSNGGSGGGHYAIDAAGGELDVFDSEFEGESRHIRFQGKPDELKIVGNRFAGSPDLALPKRAGALVDHTAAPESSREMKPIQPVPDRLPARTGPEAFYLATASPFNVPSDGEADATDSLQKVLDQAGRDGGGTVYLPQGRYRLTRQVSVPPGVELRGINDFMPRGTQSRTLLVADVPQDRDKPDNPPLLTLQSSPELGGSGIAGLAIWYLHQDYTDIQAFPWTIRGLGPGCWVQRIFLGNCYNAVDFATHDSDRHVLSRVCGSALNRAFLAGNSKTIGWIDNCHIRPQDWALSSTVESRHRNGTLRRRGFVFEIPGEPNNKPTSEQVFRGTEHSLIPNLRGAGVITVGSGANEQITAFFTNGSTRALTSSTMTEAVGEMRTS